MRETRSINWPTFLFLILTPIIGMAGLIWLWWHDGLYLKTIILTVVMGTACGMSITGGYHRLYSHRSYEASWAIKLFYLLFGAANFQGSVIEWSSDHRYHHRFVDGKKDPYSIKKGFWYAHIGWLFFKDPEKPTYNNVKDIEKETLARLQHKFYIPLASFMCFLFPMGVATLWGDPWGGLLIAGVARVVLNHHFTFSINSFCHYIGSQPYSDSHTARDSWVAALLTYGEGYHNFHHEYPIDYRNGIKFYQWDPTKWMIGFFSWFGLARNLRKVDRHRILEKKLEMEERRLKEKVESYSQRAREKASQMLSSTREKVEQLSKEWSQLKEDYSRLKEEKMEGFRRELKKVKSNLKETKRQLKEALSHWKNLPRELESLAQSSA